MQQFNLQFRGIKLGTCTVNATSLDEAKSQLLKELHNKFTYLEFIELDDGILTDREGL